MILVGNKSDLEPERTVSRCQNIFELYVEMYGQYQVPMQRREQNGTSLTCRP